MNSLLRSLAKLCPRLAFVALAVVSLFPSAALAVNVTEPPDFPNNAPGPATTLTVGPNTFSGAVTSGSDQQDRFAVTVPAGFTITAVTSTMTNGDIGGTTNNFINFNGEDALGAGGHTFGATAGLPLGPGTYNALASVDFGVNCAWSVTFTLTASGGGVAPVVTTNPVSAARVSGQSVSFTAAATGTPAPTVQWQVSTDGGANFSDIGGQTGTTLTFTPVVADNAKQYRARFSNATASNVATTAAILTVTKANTVTGLVSGTNPSLVGNAVTFTATVTAQAPGAGTPTGNVSFSDGAGNLFNGTLSGGVAAVNITYAVPGNYTATATYVGDASFNGSNGNVAQTVNQPPQVTGNPVSQLIIAGNNVSFVAAAAVGFPAPTVQWQLSTNGGGSFAPIGGATNPTLTLNAVTFALNNNQYRAVFTNIAGNATSNAALLTVNRKPLIPNPVPMQRSASLAAKLTVAQVLTLGGVSDPDADTFSVTGVSGGVNATVSLSGGFVIYTPNAGNVTGDTFSFTVTDARGAAQTGTINVTIAPAPPGVAITQFTILPSGVVTITFSGVPGFTYGVQHKPTLASPTWTDIASVTVDSNGVGTTVHNLPPGTPSAFYQLVYPAPGGP